MTIRIVRSICRTAAGIATSYLRERHPACTAQWLGGTHATLALLEGWCEGPAGSCARALDLSDDGVHADAHLQAQATPTPFDDEI